MFYSNRGAYQWLRDCDLNFLPDDLRDFLGLLKPKPNGSGNLVRPRQFQDVRIEMVIGRALRKASVEGRNNAGFWLACQLRDNSYSQAEAEAVRIDYAKRVDGTNTKGEKEAYQTTEAISSVRAAYDRLPREPWKRSIQQGLQVALAGVWSARHYFIKKPKPRGALSICVVLVVNEFGNEVFATMRPHLSGSQIHGPIEEVE